MIMEQVCIDGYFLNFSFNLLQLLSVCSSIEFMTINLINPDFLRA